MPYMSDRYIGQSIDVTHSSGDVMRIEIVGIVEETGQIRVLLDADNNFVFSKSKRNEKKLASPIRGDSDSGFNKKDMNKNKKFPSDC